MRNTYIFGAILFIGIVGGALVWRQQKPPEVLTSMPADIITPMSTPTQKMKKTYLEPPTMSIDTQKTYTATMVTDKGTMAVRLFADEAPITVNNFVTLSRDGFYENTVFHRIIKDFMIQGGDPRGDGTGDPGYKFADEKITREYTRGTIAMANSGPHTNGSQFFIMHKDYPLPKQYVIFGAIDPNDSSSLATLDAIAATAVSDNGMGEESKPVTPIVLQSISIEEK